MHPSCCVLNLMRARPYVPYPYALRGLWAMLCDLHRTLPNDAASVDRAARPAQTFFHQDAMLGCDDMNKKIVTLFCLASPDSRVRELAAASRRRAVVVPKMRRGGARPCAGMESVERFSIAIWYHPSQSSACGAHRWRSGLYSGVQEM